MEAPNKMPSGCNPGEREGGQAPPSHVRGEKLGVWGLGRGCCDVHPFEQLQGCF